MKIVFSIVKKELLYISRDKRTIFLGTIIPIIFMMIYGFFSDSVLSVSSDMDLVKYLLFIIVTMMIFLSMITGALEIGVGEKEKGTIINVLQTGVGFFKLFIGKMIALVLQGIATLIIIDLTILLLSIFTNGFYNKISLLDGSKNYYFMLNAITIVNILFISSLELLISFLSKNFKEGQLLSFPIMMMILGSFYYILYSKFYANINPSYYGIPFINIAVLAKQICQNKFSSLDIAIYILLNITYIVIITTSVNYFMRRESNLMR